MLRCLQKNPDDRFRDAFHFLDELRATRELLGPVLSWGGLNESDAGEQEPARDDDVPVPFARATPVPVREGRTPVTEPAFPPGSEAREDSTLPPPPGEEGGAGEDDLGEAGSSRRMTLEYVRPPIPVAPNADLEIDVDVEVEAPVSSLSESGVSTGLSGAKRWRERFEAIQRCVDELGPRGIEAPEEIAASLALAERSLEALEESVRSARMHQQAVEGLADRARDFRATLGKTIDELAADLGKRRGELTYLAQRRNDLYERREAARRGVRLGDTTEGQADALLWELAAAEEELRQKSHECDEVEAHLGELRARLERENEELEIELSVHTHVLDQEMARLWPLANELRDPLQHVEDWLEERWSEGR